MQRQIINYTFDHSPISTEYPAELIMRTLCLYTWACPLTLHVQAHFKRYMHLWSFQFRLNVPNTDKQFCNNWLIASETLNVTFYFHVIRNISDKLYRFLMFISIHVYKFNTPMVTSSGQKPTGWLKNQKTDSVECW